MAKSSGWVGASRRTVRIALCNSSLASSSWPKSFTLTWMISSPRVAPERHHQLLERNDSLVVKANMPRKSPCFSRTPITSKGRRPMTDACPRADSRANRLVATVEPITQTGRPPWRSGRARESAHRRSRCRRSSTSWSVEPTIRTSLAMALLVFDRTLTKATGVTARPGSDHVPAPGPAPPVRSGPFLDFEPLRLRIRSGPVLALT